ncbi:hypothetical protein CR513_45187, partial [Mucuna pruriens]
MADQKFFVKAFRKGLRARQFNDSLTLRKPLSMEEIRTRAEKHIEVEEYQANQLEAKRQSGSCHTRPPSQGDQKGENKHPPKPKDYPLILTPLMQEKSADIYPKEAKVRKMEVNKQEWCKFHRAYGHATEDFCTLQEHIEKLI